MYAAIVKALTATNGPDISGKVVPMPAGTYHLVSKDALPFFNSHPDVFQVTYEADDAYPGLLSTDANNNTVLVGADGYPIRTKQTKLDLALGTLDAGMWPMNIVALGDSTGNNDDEWIHLLAEGLASKYTDYTVNYRVFAGTTEQYESITNLSTGSAGLAYFLTGTNAANKRYSIADSAATSVTGDIDVRFKISLNGALPSATFTLGGKWGSAPQRSWYMDITNTGTLSFTWSADGTNTITKTSTAVITELTSPIWVRATLDVDNGASGNTTRFYTSTDDGATWTLLGTAVVTATATSIYDGTSATQFIGKASSSMTQQDHDIKFYGMQVYGSLDNSVRVIDIDAGGLYQYDFSAYATMVDDSGNTVTIAGTYGSYAGSPRLAIFNGSVTGAVIADATTYYTQMVGVTGSPAIAIINYGHNDTSDIEYRTDYKALTDALLVTSPDIAIIPVLQNRRKSPAVSIYQHSLRMDQVRKLAVSEGFYVIDFYSGWLDSNTDTDGIHPNTNGKLAGGQVAKYHFGCV